MQPKAKPPRTTMLTGRAPPCSQAAHRHAHRPPCSQAVHHHAHRLDLDARSALPRPDSHKGSSLTANPAAVAATPLLPSPSGSASATITDGRMGKGWEDMEVRVAAFDGARASNCGF